MQKDGEGREILRKLRIEKIVDVREKDYEDVMHLYDEVKKTALKRRSSDER